MFYRLNDEVILNLNNYHRICKGGYKNIYFEHMGESLDPEATFSTDQERDAEFEKICKLVKKNI